MNTNQAASNALASWSGEVIAGVIRTENWTGQLEAFSDRLVLSGPMGLCYELAAENIESIQAAEGRFLFWSWRMKTSVSFVHSQEGVPAPLAFQTKSIPAVDILSNLNGFGFRVKMPSKQ